MLIWLSMVKTMQCAAPPLKLTHPGGDSTNGRRCRRRGSLVGCHRRRGTPLGRTRVGFDPICRRVADDGLAGRRHSRVIAPPEIEDGMDLMSRLNFDDYENDLFNLPKNLIRTWAVVVAQR